MLKACWDCLARDGARNEESYGVQLNGNLNRSPPPWPQSSLRNEKMFLLPTEFAPNDTIKVKVESTRQDTLTVSLVTDRNGPDYSNTACQVNLNFSNNILSVKTIQDGSEETLENEGGYTPGDFISENAFNIIFSMRENGRFLDIILGGSILYTFEPKHSISNIRYLTVHGDVIKVNGLDFTFGN